MSLNAWCAAALATALQEGLATPVPQAPLVTPAQVLSDYIAGRQTLSPCGKPHPCEGDGQVDDFAGARFCRPCGIRLT